MRRGRSPGRGAEHCGRRWSGLCPAVPFHCLAQPFRGDDGAGPLRVTGQGAVARQRCHCLQHATAGRGRADHSGRALAQVVVYGLHPVDHPYRDRSPGCCPPLLVGGPAAHLGAPDGRPPDAAIRHGFTAPRADPRAQLLRHDSTVRLTYGRTRELGVQEVCPSLLVINGPRGLSLAEPWPWGRGTSCRSEDVSRRPRGVVGTSSHGVRNGVLGGAVG